MAAWGWILGGAAAVVAVVALGGKKKSRRPRTCASSEVVEKWTQARSLTGGMVTRSQLELLRPRSAGGIVDDDDLLFNPNSEETVVLVLSEDCTVVEWDGVQKNWVRHDVLTQDLRQFLATRGPSA